MKHYNAWVERMDCNRSANFKYQIREDSLFYTFMSMGYRDICSYYSMIAHERYYKESSNVCIFIWRDAGSYYIESSVELGLKLADIQKEVPVRQVDPFVIEVKLFTSTLLRQIDSIIFE